jgi:DNA-binding GntR family transcriptional regulator
LDPSTSVVDRVYEEMKGLLVSHALKPGDRVNEVELSKQFGVSRTPLREALNRLRSEGFLRFVPKRGYYCRHLNPKEVFDLFELRKAIEISGIKLAMVRVREQQIDVLSRFLDDAELGAAERTIEELARLDERFHERLLEMSGNTEMVRVLRNVNARIWPVRWADWDESTRAKSRADHRALLSALRLRDEKGAVEILDSHITRRIDQITTTIKERLAHIYLAAQDLANTV